MARHREQAMAVKRAVVAAVVGQFSRPRGTAGNLAGRVIAHRPSNRRRNRWVVSSLDARPADRVLEVALAAAGALREGVTPELATRSLAAALYGVTAAICREPGNRGNSRLSATVRDAIVAALLRTDEQPD